MHRMVFALYYYEEGYESKDLIKRIRLPSRFKLFNNEEAGISCHLESKLEASL